MVRKTGTRKRPTLADVARIAGVSHSTASRTFTPGTSVDQQTRARVLAAAEQAGYARTLPGEEQKTASRTIGIVMGAFDNPFYHTVLSGFLEEFRRRDLRSDCLVANGLADAERAVETLISRRVDVLVVAALGLGARSLEAARAAGIPLLLFNRTLSEHDVFSVQTDNTAGGALLADFLLRAGHQRLAFISGLEGASTNRDRRKGFEAELQKHGAAPPLIEFGDFTYEGGREATRRLMLGPEPPDAIFCANDIMAFGAIDTLKLELGISIPDEVSIVGFDDVPMAAWPPYQLTTMRQRRNQMIARSMDHIDRLLADGTAGGGENLIEGRLIVRETARRPAHQARLQEALAQS